MIPEERRRRRLTAVAPDERGHEDAPKPYLDIALARGRLQVVAWLTLAAVAAAEVTVLMAGGIGVVLYGVVTVLLLTAGGKVTSRRLRALFWALAVVPTSRLVAFGAPLGELGSEIRLVLVGVLTLLATAIAIRATDLTRDEVGLTMHWRQVPVVLAMTPVWLGLGVLERAVAGAPVLGGSVGIGLLMIVAALGVADDLFFQGLLFEAARRVVGRLGVPFVALLVSVLHIAYASLPLAASAFVAALLFGWVRARTGSLGGVIVGHLALNIGIFIIGPEVAPWLMSRLSAFFSSIGVHLVGLLVTAGGMSAGG